MKKQLPTYDQALLRLQTDYPTQWQILINKATQSIKATMRQHKLEMTPQGLREAITLCLSIHQCDAATAFTLFAAAGIMQKLDDLEKEHYAIELREMNIELQMQKLPEVDWKDQDKKEVGDYYRRRMASVKCRITEIINEVTALGNSLGVAPPEPVKVQWVPQPRRPFGHWGHGGGAVSA